MEPTKIGTISYQKQAFESLPRCVQRQAGTKENWEKIQRECAARAPAPREPGKAIDDGPNSRASNLSRMEAGRREWNAKQPRFPDGKSAIKAMGQYLRGKEPYPLAADGETLKAHRLRMFEYSRGRRLQPWYTVGPSGSVFPSQRSGKADDKAAAIAGGSRASRAGELEEEGWVMVPLGVVASKCRDDPSSEDESDDFDIDEDESDEDESDEDEGDQEEV